MNEILTIDEQLIVPFKSTPNNYEKEKKGIKNNTVRYRDEDYRFELLDDFAARRINKLYIKITNTETSESFTRKVIDVTIYNNIYIVTWDIIISYMETLIDEVDSIIYWENPQEKPLECKLDIEIFSKLKEKYSELVKL